MKKIMGGLFASAAVLFILAFPHFRSLIPYAWKPQALYLYASNPAMRDLMHLIAAQRLQGFMTVWDTSTGVSLSKKLFQPIHYDGKIHYRYLPHLKKVSFETGTDTFRRKMEAPDTPRLREVLTRLKTNFISEATFDEHGFRKTGYESVPGCAETLLLLGDSFTEGLWVNDQETFAARFAALLNRQKPVCVRNSGTNGFGIVEEAHAATSLYPSEPFQTMMLFHYPNDIHADTFAVLNEELTDLEELWEQHFKDLGGLAAFAMAKGIRFILVPIPPKEQFAMPESIPRYQEKLKRFCEQTGIEFWDPLPDLMKHTWEEIYFDWDPHFSAAGHDLFARLLADRIRMQEQPS